VSTVHRDPFHAVILPRLVLVADRFASGRPGMPADAVRARVREAVHAGVAWVHLRDYGADDAAFAAAAPRFADELRELEPSLMLSVSRRADLARALGAGVHTGRGGPHVAEARAAVGPLQPVGYSAHDPEEACAAAEEGADYVYLGPIYSTTSHPDRPPLGLEVLREACLAAQPVPVYAIGGITPERAAAVHAAGAYGAAVLRGVLDAPDAGAAVAAFLRALRPPSATLDHPIHA
jgi:thiamine-phosphate diphosphorylase